MKKLRQRERELLLHSQSMNDEYDEEQENRSEVSAHSDEVEIAFARR